MFPPCIILNFKALGLKLEAQDPGALTHGRARRAGFDGVGVPGLDQYPVCRG